MSLTQRCAGASGQFQPVDVMSRAAFQEAVPNSDPISITARLKLNKHLNNKINKIHTQQSQTECILL